MLRPGPVGIQRRRPPARLRGPALSWGRGPCPVLPPYTSGGLPMKVKLLALALAGLLTAAGAAREDDAKKDLKQVQGTWEFTSQTENGQELTAEQLKDFTITFEGDKFTVKRGSEVVQAGTNKFDASKTPKTVDA